MRHLIVCNEYPPAPLGQPGGIGTYAANVARLLAEAGETVHVIGTLWEGAPREVEVRCGGRLVVHRVPLDQPLAPARRRRGAPHGGGPLEALYHSEFPPQAFSWQAALLAEHLVESERIDVIEAQEFHAPLYCFQARRALGLGPSAQPPCIVHLHSPSELIVRHNEQDASRPFFATARRLEAYTIAAGDARLCASRALARQSESLYGLASGSVTVIPYPIGDVPRVERSASVWQRGPICFVGRLELRKGLLEWVDAAVTVAQERPDAWFEFVGADTRREDGTSVQRQLEARVPRSLRRRFRFQGARRHAEVPRLLAAARVAVVPSRWDNFPNACMEAMATGLPVIATREGGMAEMLEDGRTGWLAPERGSAGLARALRSALEAPPERLVEMGAEAARAIRRLCGDAQILERSLALRRSVAHAGVAAAPLASDPALLPAWLAGGALPSTQRHTAPGDGPILRPSDLWRVGSGARLRLLRKALRRPDRAARFLWWHGWRAVQRGGLRLRSVLSRSR